MTRPVVVAVSEGEEARGAVALGLTAARLLGAPLVLAGVAVVEAAGRATVVPGWVPAGDPAPLRDYVARAVDRRAATLPRDVPSVARAVVACDVVPGLELVVAEEDAQLLVVGASHLGPLARGLRGDVGTDAVRRTGCAVLVAPTGADAVADAPPRRIGVAWDGDQESDAALALGAELAAAAGAELVVLRAAREDRRELAGTALAAVVARLGERVASCEGRLLDGPPAGALVAATGDVDLMVLGAHARGAIATALLGSVSATVLRHARCPVLVLPHGARVAVAAGAGAGVGA